MTQDQIESIHETYLTCLRLAKGLIVAGRSLGQKLSDVYNDVPVSDNINADEQAWAVLIQKQFGIVPEISTLFADFSVVPEVETAQALPPQDMPMRRALQLLGFLIPVDMQSDSSEAAEVCKSTS